MPQNDKQETPEQREKRRQAHILTVLAEQSEAARTELEAMQQVFAILHPLPGGSQKRIVRWVADRIDNFTPPMHTFDDGECPF